MSKTNISNETLHKEIKIGELKNEFILTDEHVKIANGTVKHKGFISKIKIFFTPRTVEILNENTNKYFVLDLQNLLQLSILSGLFDDQEKENKEIKLDVQ